MNIDMSVLLDTVEMIISRLISSVDLTSPPIRTQIREYMSRDQGRDLDHLWDLFAAVSNTRLLSRANYLILLPDADSYELRLRRRGPITEFCWATGLS
jgi:hypothetical protein